MSRSPPPSAAAAKPWSPPADAFAAPPAKFSWGKLLPFVGPVVLFIVWDAVVRAGLINLRTAVEPMRTSGKPALALV